MTKQQQPEKVREVTLASHQYIVTRGNQTDIPINRAMDMSKRILKVAQILAKGKRNKCNPET